MNFKLVELERFDVSGVPVSLTNSQSENFMIILEHWKIFNKKLRTIERQKGKNWTKFAVTFRKNNNYYYMPSVMTSENSGLVTHSIPKSNYAIFQHKGDMRYLKQTIYTIYKQILPASSFHLITDRTIIHFEKYDYRFKWNRADSIIDIYVPVEKQSIHNVN